MVKHNSICVNMVEKTLIEMYKSTEELLRTYHMWWLGDATPANNKTLALLATHTIPKSTNNTLVRVIFEKYINDV